MKKFAKWVLNITIGGLLLPGIVLGLVIGLMVLSFKTGWWLAERFIRWL